MTASNKIATANAPGLREWTAEDVLALPVTVDLLTAGEVLGLRRTATYQTARAGRFPVPLIRVGSRYRVAAADLQRALGLDVHARSA
jgi:hypothetical protein